ncbi:MAG: hypothetical protein UX30_C0015G0002 [Candidatus Saccharibacteria bacterium GW2011_GWA2_46_10]|nr:MAG: hypothetical protein UX30_C0015G0002 [Candidatus Saccharibacteria bacterium GW2011_GWA2_46_10]
MGVVDIALEKTIKELKKVSGQKGIRDALKKQTNLTADELKTKHLGSVEAFEKFKKVEEAISKSR